MLMFGCDSSAISVSTITRLRLAMVPVALDWVFSQVLVFSLLSISLMPSHRGPLYPVKLTVYEPGILVLFPYAGSEGLDEPANLGSLIIAFAAQKCKVEIKMKAEAKF